MSFVIRPARAEDVASIAGWTRDTFSWGDYVPEQLPLWLEDPESLVIVCVHGDDVPVALSRTQLLSPTEAWLSAARVHPDHRRAGMGMAMNHFGVEWARARGALVARLAIEEENRPARSQVEKAGYRLTSRWLYTTSGPSPGPALPADRVLRPALTIDADAAWVFWSQSDLARAGRELISEGWRWRKATRRDLEDAVNDHAFYQGPAGWAIVRPVGGGLAVRWLATTAPDAPLMLQGLRDLARARDELEAMIPETPWMVEALQREAFDAHPVLIYSKAL